MFLLPIMVTMYKIMSSFSPLYTEDIMVYMRDLPFQKKTVQRKTDCPPNNMIEILCFVNFY